MVLSKHAGKPLIRANGLSIMSRRDTLENQNIFNKFDGYILTGSIFDADYG